MLENSNIKNSSNASLNTNETLNYSNNGINVDIKQKNLGKKRFNEKFDIRISEMKQEMERAKEEMVENVSEEEAYVDFEDDEINDEKESKCCTPNLNKEKNMIKNLEKKGKIRKFKKSLNALSAPNLNLKKSKVLNDSAKKSNNLVENVPEKDFNRIIDIKEEEDNSEERRKINESSGIINSNLEINRNVINEINELRKEIETIKKKDDIINELRMQLKAYEDEAKERNALSLSIEDNKMIKKLIEEKKNGNAVNKEEIGNEINFREIKNNIEELKNNISQIINDNLAKSFKETLKKEFEDLLKQNNDEMQQNLIGDLSSIKYDLDSKMSDVDNNATIAEMIKEIKEKNISEIAEIKSLLDNKADKNDVSKDEIESIKGINVALNKKISQLENQNEKLKKEIAQNNYLENVQENGALKDMNANLNLNLKKLIALINNSVSININNYNLEYNIKKKEVIKNIYIELANDEYFTNWLKEKWKEWNEDNRGIMSSLYNKINELNNEMKGYAKDILEIRNALLIKNQMNDINENAKNLMNAIMLNNNRNNESVNKMENKNELLNSIREINKGLFSNIKESMDKDIKRIEVDINNKENNIRLSYEKLIDDKIRGLSDKIETLIKNNGKENDERYRNEHENINKRLDKLNEDIILKVSSLSPKRPEHFEEVRPIIGFDYKNEIQNLKNEFNQKINNIEIKINNDTSFISINNKIDNLTNQFNLINNVKKNEVIIEKGYNNVPNMSNIGSPSINIYPPNNSVLKDNNEKENLSTTKSMEKLEREINKKIDSINEEIKLIKNRTVVKKEECINNKNNIKLELMVLINSTKDEIKKLDNKYDNLKKDIDEIKVRKEKIEDDKEKFDMNIIIEEVKKKFYTKEEINQREDVEVIDEERAREIAREVLKEGNNEVYSKNEIDEMIEQIKSFKKKNLSLQKANFKIIQMAKKKESNKKEEQRNEKESDSIDKEKDNKNGKENKKEEEKSSKKENDKKPIEPKEETLKKEVKIKSLCTKENCKYCKAIENVALNNKNAIVAINEEMTEVNRILKEIGTKIASVESKTDKIDEDIKRKIQIQVENVIKTKIKSDNNRVEDKNKLEEKKDLNEIIAKIAEEKVKVKIEETIKEKLTNKEENNKDEVNLKELTKKEKEERKKWMINYFEIKEGKIRERIKRELERLNNKICVRRLKLEVEDKKINNRLYFSVQNDKKEKKDNNKSVNDLKLHISLDDINNNSYNKEVSIDYDENNMYIEINKETKICAICLKENHDGKECLNWIQDSVMANWMYNKKDVLKEYKINEAMEKIIKCKYCMETNHNEEECMNSIDLLKIIAKYVITIKKENDNYIIERVNWDKASSIIDKILEIKKKCSEKDMFKNIWKNIRMKGSRSMIEWFKKNRIIFKASDLNSNEKKKILMDAVTKQLRKVQKNKMNYAKRCFTKIMNTIARKVAMIQVLTNEVNGKTNKNIQILNIGRNNITDERNKIIREIEIDVHINRNNNLAEMIKTDKREIKTANTLLKSPNLAKRNAILIRSFIKEKKYNLGRNKRKLNATVNAKSKVNKYLKEVEVKENNKQDKKVIILKEIKDKNNSEDDKKEKKKSKAETYEEEEKLMEMYEPPRDDKDGNDSEGDAFNNMMSEYEDEED